MALASPVCPASDRTANTVVSTPRRPRWITVDGNEAVASVAHRASEVIAIYPITPSSPMGELADEWSARGRPNIWGTVPEIIEMQSEGGAIGAVHGALQAGALATTFTSSQGLLLMIPNLYKIAGELLPFAFHVAARTVATHALSIFGDHSDVMACRQVGVAMLASGSVQEAHDFAAIAHAATLATRLPFLHFFDGFRTSHEVSKIQALSDEDLRALINPRRIAAHRDHALSPDRPVIRGTAQNPDVFFQAREAANPFYLHAPGAVRGLLGRFAELTGRQYRLFEYFGHPDAERVIVLMGSGAETAHETVEWLVARGERVGILKVRLFRPFSTVDFLAALPLSANAIAVLDRTKEPGATGEPLYLDVVDALVEAQQTGAAFKDGLPAIVGGRYGLSSKEFTPAHVKAVFDELRRPRPRRHFTVGIVDDITGLSLKEDLEFDIEPDDVERAIFFGLGSDGTVGANKNSSKIIGEETDRFVQAYFVYDSKKSGAVTISHLRFGPRPVRSAYLVNRAQFVACHQPELLDRYDVLDHIAPGGVFLLNTSVPPDQVWDSLTSDVQQQILDKGVDFYVIDARRLAKDAGLGSRINTIMQTGYFLISGVLPREQAITRIRESILKTYGKRGDEVVRRNIEAVNQVVDHCFQVNIPNQATATRRRDAVVPDEAPDFVKRVTAMMLAGKGDLLPVSAFPVDGTWPPGTSKWEKRNIASEIPVWDPPLCIQCNKCALVCPHAAIRIKVYDARALESRPPTFKLMDYTGKEFGGSSTGPAKYTIQVAPEDCTGCSVCVMVCPAHDKSHPEHRALEMRPHLPLRDAERSNYAFFLELLNPDRRRVKRDNKGTQLLEPLFEYSGACAGCGETPYIKLLTQLFGDRALVANATGCSSIFGANLPTTPYTCNADGRGPAWANSLFEDNAEFGLGFRLAVDRHTAEARALVEQLRSVIGEALADELLTANQQDEAGLALQRERLARLRSALAGVDRDEARRLAHLADYLVKKSVWIVGGDGWAYDIGYGGLDHVLASTRDVNILVLDTEVYSNTGGQQSKATPLAASARFAIAGKAQPKKDLGLMAMTYGHVYVAQVALGARDAQTVKAFLEAESYPGPSLIIAYSPCIAHGYDLACSLSQEKAAVETGYWPLYRFDPRKRTNGDVPLTLDSSPPRGDLREFFEKESRFRVVEREDPERFKRLAEEAAEHVRRRYAFYQKLAARAH